MDDYQKYITDPKVISMFQSFLVNDQQELYSPEGVPALIRKAWHTLAEKYKLYAISAGEGACRHVIISKKPFTVSDKPLLLTPSAQRNFRDDFGIKMNLCDHEDFEYYVDLFKARYQLNLTLDAIHEFPNEHTYMSYLIEVKKKIWTYMKNTDHYKKFLTDDFTEYIKKTKEIKEKFNFDDNYLDRKNNNKLFVSIDLKSANYNTMFWYCKEIFNNKPWKEFVSSFSDYPKTAALIQESKMFRQKVFWELNQERQAILWDYLITKATSEINFPFIKAYHVGDEIVFEIENENINLDLDDNIYRVRVFRLQLVADNRKWLIRKYLDNSIDIKCCSPTEYTVVWKKVHKLEIDKRDLKVKWDQKKEDWIYMDLVNIDWLV